MARARFRRHRPIWLGAMLFCGAAAVSTASAEAAARRSAGPVRRTASAAASETNDTAPRARRSIEPRTVARGEKRGAKTPSEATTSASNSKVPLDGKAATDGKAVVDPKLADSTKPGGDVARSVDNKSDARGNADARAAVKAPSDLPAPPKSTVEKLGAEVGASARDRGTDGHEMARPNSDAARSVGAQATSLAANGSNAAPPSTGAPSGSGAPSRPVVVTLDEPVFDGGDVPKAAASLERMKAGFARCVATENALTKNEASIDLRFLVRAPGRAEGVGAEKVRGVSGDVVRCMASVLARSYIGAPSDDPVGVGVTVRVRKD